MKKNKSRSAKTVKVAVPAPRPERAVPASTGLSGTNGGIAQTIGADNVPALAAAKPRLNIPPILLEGDLPAAQPVVAHVAKGTPEPPPAAAPAGAEPLDLPTAYGTGNLLLIARDPHWLYAHWDLTEEQRQRHNALSADGHLLVRVSEERRPNHPLKEIHLQPGSRHWFTYVERAGARYVAELGYYQRDGRWKSLGVSAPAATPADTVAEEKVVRWATGPAGRPLPRAGQKRSEGTLPPEQPPQGQPEPPVEWTAAQEKALAEVVSGSLVRRSQSGSVEVAERVQAENLREIPTSLLAGVSSPTGGPPQEEFWCNINAELVLYGATAPNATVTVDGRPIPLRPDGTFSLRCALPDGEHRLSLEAASAHHDLRRAEVTVRRHTEHQGEVGVEPLDPGLAPPGPGNAA